MSEQPIYDPELARVLPALSGFVPNGMTRGDIPRLRELSSPAREEIFGDAPVECVDYRIAGFQGAEIVVSVIRRVGLIKAAAGIYCIHGGGMIMGNRFAGMHHAVSWALAHDAVCATVDYRLAPEYPAPIPAEDCYAGLCWMAAEAPALGFDRNRLVIFGGSGGGGLAASATLLARDRGGPSVFGQILQCPMLDDRDNTASTLAFDGVGVWDRTSNRTAWEAILGDRRATEQVDQACAAARASDLSGLPPAFIDVGALEVFRDEAVDYARRIWSAGGDCELHVWGGAFHGFYDIAPDSAVARACLDARDQWLARLLASEATGGLAPQ